jgi:hypothetical protein
MGHGSVDVQNDSSENIEGEKMSKEEVGEKAQVGVPKIPMKEQDKFIGKFVVLFRKDQRVAAKVLQFDNADKRIVYEVMAGTDKGKKFSSRYDDTQDANVYDEGNVILAIMDS